MKGRPYDSGPDCLTCGMKAVNVTHDDETTRARNIETWAAPSPGMDNLDYYTWANVTYHPFVPATGPRVPKASDYDRGYQAGYHARRRETA